ncbi:MAG TPA: OB-fold nucleic acid binding domain-containing protein, partial [Acidimicrobiales bacterium]|nr:OB-fold nucleic acid binding domain-containing protein [Acidimicrobiales bacterium]
MADVPYRFERDASAAELADRFKSLEAGEETDVTVSVAGRLMLRREMGRLAFGTLRDWSGSIQLFAGRNWTEDFEGFGHLSLGDWIGATGEVVRTKTGELSVKVR